MPVHYDTTIDRGDTRTLTVAVSVDDAPVDPEALTLTIRTPAGVETIYAYGSGEIARVAEGSYSFELTFLESGAYTYEWQSTAPTQVQGAILEVQPSPLDVPAEEIPEVQFASLDDLAVILGAGVASALTATQVTQAEMLLPLVAGLIIDAVDRDTAWALALDPVPPLIRAVCLTVVKRFMDNPLGARSQSETLGQYSYSASYTDGAHGLMLTDAEVTLCRRAVIGATSGSAYVDSLVTSLAPRTSLTALVEAFADDPPIYDWTN